MISRRLMVIVLVLLICPLPNLAAMGNPEISYFINGKAYAVVEGSLAEESTGKALPASSKGLRPRWYQGGSSAARPLLHVAAVQLQRDTKTKEDYLFEGMSGTQASKAVLNGQLDWAVVGRDLLLWEKEAGLRAETVAWDSLVVVVPSDLPVEAITLRRLAGVFAGQITNWSQLGGPDLAITPFAFSERSGSAGALRDLVLERTYGDDGRLTNRAILLDYDTEVYDRVGAQPGGIGVVPRSLDNVEAHFPIKFLKVDTIAPEPEEINSGRYPVARPLNFVTLGEPSDKARLVLDALLGERVQGALEGLKLLPVN